MKANGSFPEASVSWLLEHGVLPEWPLDLIGCKTDEKGFWRLKKCHRVINIRFFTRKLRGDFTRACKYSRCRKCRVQKDLYSNQASWLDFRNRLTQIWNKTQILNMENNCSKLLQQSAVITSQPPETLKIVQAYGIKRDCRHQKIIPWQKVTNRHLELRNMEDVRVDFRENWKRNQSSE